MSFQTTMKALSDPTRRKILSMLKAGKMSAGDILAEFDISGASISHHLSILKDVGLVSDDKRGKYIYYEINTSVLEEILTWIAELKN